MPAPRVGAPVVALGGLAVLAVLVQGSGAVPVELLGPDVLLVVAGYTVTATLLMQVGARGGLSLRHWYGEQLLLRAPLLVGIAAVVLAITAAAGPARRAAATGADAVAGVVGLGNWWGLGSALPSWRPLLDRFGAGIDWYVETPDVVDPLGTAWLVGLLVQLTLGWPLVLAAVRRMVGRRPRGLVVALVVLFVVAAAVGPLRAVAGAGVAELALGTHVRAAEWLLGALVAAWAAARRDGVPGLSGAAISDRLVVRAPPALTAAAGTVASDRLRVPSQYALPALAGVLLVAQGVLATARPELWLRLGGPTLAAAGAVLLLVAVHADGPLPRALSRGLPLEFGRTAYPLLLLHLPVFSLVQLAVPTARPFALLIAGGALAWLLALVVQDGLVRRVIRWRLATSTAVVLVAVAVVAGGLALYRLPTAAGEGPVVLVLGGTEASELAVALAATGRYTVVDASRPGCGLLPGTEPRIPARPSTRGQLPAAPGPACGDQGEHARRSIAGSAPAAIVADLAADAGPRADLDPCDAAFRTRYRSLLTEAVAGWTLDAPDRPVLVADGPSGTRAGRCLDALLAEAVAEHGALVPLPTQAFLCAPGSPTSCDGAGVPLDHVQRAALGRVVADTVAAELDPQRSDARVRAQR